jgi:hypothetical protein
MKMISIRSLCTTSLLVAAAAIAGCKASPYDTSFRAINSNLTPELQGTHERRVDVQRHMAATKNQNWRMFSDDLGRVFYTNHPSSLSSFPIVQTSGNPR